MIPKRELRLQSLNESPLVTPIKPRMEKTTAQMENHP
jgi:hypothetical protein